MSIATQQPASAAFRKIAALEARIAELEAERNSLKLPFETSETLALGLELANARIAFLEAERDREPGWLTGDHTVTKLKARIAELEAELQRTKENFGAFYRSGVLAEREACAQMVQGWFGFAARIRARPAP